MLGIEISNSWWLNGLPKLQSKFNVVDMIQLYSEQMQAFFLATTSLEKKNGPFLIGNFRIIKHFT